MFRWMRSFRVRLLLVICLVAGVPLGLMGLWITGSASRASERLLRERVTEVLQQVTGEVVNRWTRERSVVLDLADSAAVRSAARAGHVDQNPTPGARALTISDAAGRILKTFESTRFVGAGIELVVPIHDSQLGPRIGSLKATIPIAALLQGRKINPGSVQILVAVFDAETHAPLIPLPFEWTEDARTLEWGGDRWFIQTRSLAEPRLTLVGAAPLTPFEQPLRAAARDGLVILLAVSAVGIVLAWLLAMRTARTLNRLTDAAEAVAGGTLDRRVPEGGGTEFERLARAFNRMTSSLLSTLQELAEKRALARVGEFAASLAHEVRNPLTAIRVDLQVAGEALPEQSAPMKSVRRALGEVDRLNGVVGSVLLAARVACKDCSPVDVRVPLQAAVETARKTASRQLFIPIETHAPEPLVVAGDPSALEQIFLNLLLNAVDAVRDRGEILVVIERDDEEIVVRVEDTGTGLTADAAEHALEPFFTTREGGSGLGLTIAARLARAHDGMVDLTPLPNGGASASVRLPRYQGDRSSP